MLIFLPVLILFLAALILQVLCQVKPDLRISWLVALGATLLSLLAVIFWQIRIPASLSLPAWQPRTVFQYAPTWVADGISWPYALSLTTLAAAIVLTSVVRKESGSPNWSGILALTALGILSVSAGNPQTMILTWTTIDLVELVTMLRSTNSNKDAQAVVVAFGVRVLGMGLLILASTLASTANFSLTFDRIAERSGFLLLLAASLRLGILPFHLPFQQEKNIRRGFGTCLRLVSASASLALLARIPAGSLETSWIPLLMLIALLVVTYAGWMWLRASDEIVGRPYWVFGLATLAIVSVLRANPVGSIGWGVSLILSGGLIFLYSARQRNLIWLPLLALWGIASIPYSPTSSAWLTTNTNLGWMFVPFLLGQSFLVAGIVRHALHPGETSFESQEHWTRVLYPAGLLLLVGTLILLGLWGWEGARASGFPWVFGPISLMGLAGFFLARRLASRPATTAKSPQIRKRFEFLGLIPKYLADQFEKAILLITNTLEGEGGIFWSILLLVLILSVLASGAE